MQATINTKIDISEKKAFETAVERLGLTQSVVLRNFVKSFIKAGGFPYDVNYPVSAEERASTESLERDIANGTAKTYADMSELWEDLDNV